MDGREMMDETLFLWLDSNDDDEEENEYTCLVNLQQTLRYSNIHTLFSSQENDFHSAHSQYPIIGDSQNEYFKASMSSTPRLISKFHSEQKHRGFNSNSFPSICDLQNSKYRTRLTSNMSFNLPTAYSTVESRDFTFILHFWVHLFLFVWLGLRLLEKRSACW